jgi:IS30 family transposase
VAAVSSREQAEALRAQGMSFGLIAETIGVAKSTVYGWLNSAYAERQRKASVAWKDRNREANRARDREFMRAPEKRGVCVECGALRGIGQARRGDGLCMDCIRSHAQKRDDRIVELFEQGVSLKGIAADVGSTPGAIGVAVHRLRSAGRVGYRQHRKDAR